MIHKYVQLLSTAHRVLDGTRTDVRYRDEEKQAQRVKRGIYLLDGETAIMERRFKLSTAKYVYELKINSARCLQQALINHPFTMWVGAHQIHYIWVLSCLAGLFEEYKLQHGRRHALYTALYFLIDLPKNIQVEGAFSAPPLALPNKHKVKDAVAAYQNLYVGDKARFAKWTDRQPPEWFSKGVPEYDATYFTRTN